MAMNMLQRFGSGFASVIHKISGIACNISSFLLVILVCLIGADVVGRYIIGRSIKGAVDIYEEIMLFMVFLTMAEVQAKGENIKVDLITSRLSENLLNKLNSLTLFASLFFALLMSWQLLMRGFSLIKNPTLYTMNLEMPLGPFYIVASAGGFLLSMELLISFCGILGKAIRGGVLKNDT